MKCHGIAVKTTMMAVVHLPKSLENRSTTTPLVGIPGRPCLRWTSRTVFFVTKKKNTKSYRSHEALTRCTLESSPTILLSAARILMRISLKKRVLLEIDQHDRPLCEGSDVPCLFLQKVHQPQVPGLRCHHSTTEPNDSYSLPDMAFKCLTLMSEEWITDVL